MTGNLHLLLSLAQAIASFLPAVGMAAARSSRRIVVRTASNRAALVSRMRAAVLRKPAGRGPVDGGGPNATAAAEELSP